MVSARLFNFWHFWQYRFFCRVPPESQSRTDRSLSGDQLIGPRTGHYV